MMASPRIRAKVVRATAKVALVRVTSDDNDNNDYGKGKGGSSGKTGCPVQL
jgi:hypothetical protein